MDLKRLQLAIAIVGPLDDGGISRTGYGELAKSRGGDEVQKYLWADAAIFIFIKCDQSQWMWLKSSFLHSGTFENLLGAIFFKNSFK